MYQFEENDDFILKRALARALSAAQAPPRPINIKGDSARQFLTREILRLYREGERDVSSLANGAVGNFRNCLQVQESVHRLARSTGAQD